MPSGNSLTQLLLLSFADKRELQVLHFWLYGHLPGCPHGQ